MAISKSVTVPNNGAVFLESLLQLWMLPMQIGFEMMEKAFTEMPGSIAPAKALVEEASERVEAVTRAAEEKLSQLGEQPGETIPTPAALTA